MPGCLRIPVNPLQPSSVALQSAADAIRGGRLIAAPTDTLYGLLADARNEAALRRIYRVKERPESKPILLLVDSLNQAREVAQEIPEAFPALADEFWPGPLTMVLRARDDLPTLVTAGLGTVAVRLPSSPLVRALSKRAQCPLTGTSANRSGMPGARSADEVYEQLGTRLTLLLDSGHVARPEPSTILDLASKQPRILREGRIGSGVIKRTLSLAGFA